MLLIGVDVGGTRVKLGIIRDGQIIKKISQPTNAFDIIRQIENGVRELIQSIGLSIGDVDGVGIGFPGMVINSVVVDSANIGLKNFNLKEYFESAFGKPVIVKNDAEMATLAEHKFGAGEGSDNMVLVTLGTGVGGGIIVNDNLYTGAGGAGEFGHMILEKNGRKCSCGRMGCAEQYISLVALDRLAKEMKSKYPNTIIAENSEGHISATEIMRAFKKNDFCAIEIVNKFLQDLTSFLMDLCNIFRPNRIVIGGGITLAPELIEKADKVLKTLTQGFQNAPKVDVFPATLGNDAGILGAAVCFEGHEFKIEEKPEEISMVEPITNDSETVENLFNSNISSSEEQKVETLTQESTVALSENESVHSEPMQEEFVSQSVQSTRSEGPTEEEPTFVQESNDYVDPQLNNLEEEFENYKPLGIGLATDNENTEEFSSDTRVGVFTPSNDNEINSFENETNSDIINSMENIGDSVDPDLMEAEEGVVEDLENIEYSPELMARVNNLLKRK